MKMVVELLIPCVQDTDKAQLAAQLVLSKAQQRFRDSFEQKRQHRGFVVESNNVQFVGQGKDDVKVTDRKQLFFAGLHPSFSGYLQVFFIPILLIAISTFPHILPFSPEAPSFLSDTVVPRSLISALFCEDYSQCCSLLL
jgi:hypothetical protein